MFLKYLKKSPLPLPTRLSPPLSPPSLPRHSRPPPRIGCMGRVFARIHTPRRFPCIGTQRHDCAYTSKLCRYGVHNKFIFGYSNMGPRFVSLYIYDISYLVACIIDIRTYHTPTSPPFTDFSLIVGGGPRSSPAISTMPISHAPNKLATS